MTADHILFRCSALGQIMTEPRSKSEAISETAKRFLIERFVNERYQRYKDVESKYIRKGLMVEESAITLYSTITGNFHLKNTVRFNNDFLTGEPDIITDDLVIDVKSSWDIFTFHSEKLNLMKGKLNPDYYWQVQGYMELTGKKKAQVVYCLIDTPRPLIDQALRSLQYKMGVTDPFNDATFQEAIEETERLMIYSDIPKKDETERLMIYSDIPKKDRVIVFDVEHNPEDIERLYSRIGDCRKWMQENLLG